MYECVYVNVSALKIHLSESAHNAIMAFPEFITECRGDITVKVTNSCYFYDPLSPSLLVP